MSYYVQKPGPPPRQSTDDRYVGYGDVLKQLPLTPEQLSIAKMCGLVDCGSWQRRGSDSIERVWRRLDIERWLVKMQVIAPGFPDSPTPTAKLAQIPIEGGPYVLITDLVALFGWSVQMFDVIKTMGFPRIAVTRTRGNVGRIEQLCLRHEAIVWLAQVRTLIPNFGQVPATPVRAAAPATAQAF